MTKKIKHVSELPEWFNLNKYEFTKSLDALGWFKQLAIRSACLYKADNIGKNIKIENNSLETLTAVFKIIRDNPNLNVVDETVLTLHSFLHDNLPFSPPRKAVQILGVHPVTLSELFELNESVNSQCSEETLDEPLHNSINTQTESMIDILMVNYSFSDSFLIENFKQCLANARKKQKSYCEEPFRQSDFNQWVKLGILPYLDLVIWAMEMNLYIPNRVIADALYPSGEKGEETVRKTTTPLIYKLFSNKAMMQLHAQAAIKIAERNNK